VYLYIVYLALLQAPAQQLGVPLRADCSNSATVLANLVASSPVQVRSSISGYEKVCYAVTVIVDTKPVKGYVLGTDLAAVAGFERRRAAEAALTVNVEPAPPSEPGTTPPIPAEKPHYPPFKDFSARDMKGGPVSAHSLKGKVNLVCFWSPRHQDAARELLVVSRLYGQFKKQGLDALAVSLGDRAGLLDALDDFHLGFPNVPNGYDIAARYNIDYGSLPRTYVLNENFEVIASGVHGKALEDLVKKLVAAE
jgi:hypothetical protein